jgi:hypothetical protein
MNDVANFVGNSQWPLAPENIDNSLRFDDGSSDHLTRTPSSSGDRRTFTISTWVKRSALGSNKVIISAANSGNRDWIQFDSDDLTVAKYNSGYEYRFITNRKFRDTSAWYHIVVAFDTTQGTESNRVKIYVNGTQETSFETSSYPSQNFDTNYNTVSLAQNIGKDFDASNYFDGYMAEVVMIDGVQLDPTSFGEFDTTTGIWKPKKIGSFTSAGTNSFYLDFKDSSNVGKDASGLSNNFTVNNLTSIDQSTDTCVENFATLNPLNNTTDGSPAVYSEGNLKFVTAGDASGKRYGGTGTIGVSKGKWYWEVKHGSTDGGGTLSIGITHDMGLLSRSSPQYVGGDDASFGYYGGDGDIYHNNSDNTYGNTFGDGDIIGVALDVDNLKLYFSKNGVFQNSGDPTSGATGTGAFSIDSLSGTVDGVYVPAVSDINSTPNVVGEINFGAPSFAISSGNSDANGFGNFEYSVPSGYYALNTSNLNTYG